MIKCRCTSCGRSLEVADNLAGKKVRCPLCKSVFPVPEASAASSKQAGPAPVPDRTPQHTVMDHVVGIVGVIVIVLSLWGFAASGTDLSLLVCVVGFIGGWILVSLASIIGLLKD